ncbi:MAG: alkaline phosphatase family protein [Nocardioides sp.]|nr:alkaline phosphatase family protein [Nocardioides sp.]
MRTVLVAPVLALLLTPALASPVATGAPTAHVSASAPAPRAAAVSGTRVLAISVDGLNPRAITRLGRDAAPTFYRLLDEGASTFNARTQYEQTRTLPNHASMLTGRRIKARRGGHGVTWNGDRKGSTVQKAAGRPVESIFTTVRTAGGSSALFAGSSTFSLFRRSWRGGIDRFVVDPRAPRLITAVQTDLTTAERDFTFLHVALPDLVGHADGFMSPEYVDAVARTDRLLGRLLETIESTPALSKDMLVLLTADHGGIGATHTDRTRLENVRVPFFAWGRGIERADLYDLNPSFTDPGTRRPGYATAQPIRNGMLADLAAGLMGLPSVPGSTQDADQALRVTAAGVPG